MKLFTTRNMQRIVNESVLMDLKKQGTHPCIMLAAMHHMGPDRVVQLAKRASNLSVPTKAFTEFLKKGSDGNMSTYAYSQIILRSYEIKLSEKTASSQQLKKQTKISKIDTPNIETLRTMQNIYATPNIASEIRANVLEKVQTATSMNDLIRENINHYKKEAESGSFSAIQTLAKLEEIK